MVINIFDPKSFIVMYKKGVINEFTTSCEQAIKFQPVEVTILICLLVTVKSRFFQITLGKENWFELWEVLLNLQGWTEMYSV